MAWGTNRKEYVGLHAGEVQQRICTTTTVLHMRSIVRGVYSQPCTGTRRHAQSCAKFAQAHVESCAHARRAQPCTGTRTGTHNHTHFCTRKIGDTRSSSVPCAEFQAHPRPFVLETPLTRCPPSLPGQASILPIQGSTYHYIQLIPTLWSEHCCQVVL